MNEQAKKNDDGKPRVDLVPFDAIEAAGEVLAFGAKKYGTWNWTKGPGLAWHRLVRAALSHLGKWAMGEDKDPESGLSHLAHALCCVMFLVTYERRKHGVDDRPRLPWFAQNDGKDASSDTIPVPSSEPANKPQEGLALGDEVIGTFQGVPEPVQGRIVAVRQEAKGTVIFTGRFTQADGKYFEAVCLEKQLRKVPAPNSDPVNESQEDLVLGDEVTAPVAQPGGGHVYKQGRIVRILHAGQEDIAAVRFAQEDGKYLELVFMLNELRKIPKQEAPMRADLTTCPHCGDLCCKGIGKCSPTCTAPDDRETPIPGSVPPAERRAILARREIP